ncbi:MAG: hypothetical protein L6305_04845, partial [Actinomycetia bacterium]|nr:hypothetical protein [bacterium]MCG2791063.1 hypothetical protein [Actinomycetes bacterium]
LEYLNKNIQICPHWYAQYITKIEALCKLNRFDEAWSTILTLSDDPDSPLSIAELKGYYFASLGNKKEAYEQISIIENDLKNNSLLSSPDTYFLSAIYLVLKENEKALEYLEYGIEHGSTPFLFIKIDSLWDELRDHPGYLNAIKRFNFSKEGSKYKDDLKKYKKSNLSHKQARLIEKELKTLMAEERPYLNPKLSLSDLSESIDVSTNQVSQILNEYIGRNFYDFVNTYRL